MPIVKRIWSVVSKVLIALLILIMILTLVMRISGNKINILGINIYYIVTPSMEPTLKVGDMILSVNVKDYSKLEVHDVITYKGEVGSYKGKLITHEIIDIEEKEGKYTFTTKGTNNQDPDPLVSEEQVVAKMLFEIPFLGKIVTLLRNRIVFFFVLIVPLAIMLVFETKDLFQAFKKSDEKEDESIEEQN